MNQSFLASLEALIRIPSTADNPVALQQAIEWCRAYVAGTPDLFFEAFGNPDRPSLYIGLQKTRTPRVLAVAHLDVVPGNVDAFTPRVTDGRLYGRGACDMKSSALIFLELLRVFGAQKERPSFGLLLTTDEEEGGVDGARIAVFEGYRGDVLLVHDSGQDPLDIMTRAKGVATVRLTAHGKHAHGARPWLGENAIVRLMEALRTMQSALPDPLQYTVADWKETYTIVKIAGGRATNQVPDAATAIIDFRLTEARNAQELREYLSLLLPSIDVSLDHEAAVIGTANSDPLVERYVAITKELTKGDPRLLFDCGTHDGRYWGHFGMPIIASRPTSGGQHSDEEWVDIKSIETFAVIQRRFIESLTSS